MKFLFSVFIFISFFSFAQDIEDRDDSFILQNNKNQFKIIIQDQFYQVRNKSCLEFESVGFENGSSVFKNLLEEKMYAYLNSTLYVLNGDFSFIFDVNEMGEITNVEGFPKVDNSEFFFEDMKTLVSENQFKIFPAKCDGKNISSQLKLKINISSISSDM